MKLTTLKVSVPVLMMMLFQSGHGVSNWFMDACRAMKKGDIFTVQNLLIENNPGSVTMSDAGKADFVNKSEDLIKEAVKGFIPRGFYDSEGLTEDGIAFQTSLMEAMVALADVSSDSVENAFKNEVIKSFSEFLENGFLACDENVYDEVTKITNTWAISDVPEATGDDNNKVIVESLLGDKDNPADGTIRAFITAYNAATGDDADTEKRSAFSTFLKDQGLTALDLDNIYTVVETAISVEDGDGQADLYVEDTTKREAAIFEALLDRASEVRTAAIPEKSKANVPWGYGDDEEWKANAKEAIDDVWNEKDSADSLVEALYKKSAATLAKGYVTDEEDPDGYSSTNELSFYLSLFGFWNIDGDNGGRESQDSKEQFLWKILDKIEADVAANDGADAAGSDERVAWVAAHNDEVQSIVENAVYSTFGTAYEDWLRYSIADEETDLSRWEQWVTEMIAGDYTKALDDSIQLVDPDKASEIVNLVKKIQKIQ